MIISSWHLHGFIIFCVIFFAPILTGVYKNGALTWFWHCERIWAILVPVLTLIEAKQNSFHHDGHGDARAHLPGVAKHGVMS